MAREAIDRDNIGMKIPKTVNQLWTDTARKMGLDKTAVFIMALRKFAQAEGIAERPLEEDGK